MSLNSWLKHVNVLMCHDKGLNLGKQKCLNGLKGTTMIYVKEICTFIMKGNFF